MRSELGAGLLRGASRRLPPLEWTSDRKHRLARAPAFLSSPTKEPEAETGSIAMVVPTEVALDGYEDR